MINPQLQPKHTLNTEQHDWVVVGQIGAPYGVQGWQHVQSFTDPVENILQYKQLYLQQKDQWILFTVNTGRKHGQGIVVQLQGITDRDQAASLALSKIAIARTALPPLAEDEFYWADLEGLEVQTVAGEKLGKISYLYQNTNIDIMVVLDESGNKEQHIPFVMYDTVVKVNIAAKQVIVDWDVIV